MGILTNRLAQGGQAPRMVDDLSKGGFSRPAHISIADNRFTLVSAVGDAQQWPNIHIDVVIAASKAETFRVFYDGPYDRDAAAEDKVPICASQDGVTPDDNVQQQQAQACGICPQNKFGSHPNGRGGKACQEYKRIAVMVMGDMNDIAYLLGVPSASHKNLRNYAAYISKLPGAPDFHQIVTRISFESQGVLKFDPIAYVDEPTGKRMMELDRLELFDQVLIVNKSDQPRLNAPQAQPALAPAPTPVGFGSVAQSNQAVGVGRLPTFGNSPAPVAPMKTPEQIEYEQFQAWKAQQANQQSAAPMQFVQPGPPKRTRRTKTQVEEERAQQPGKGTDAPAPPKQEIIPPGTDSRGFHPPAGFQPSPNNPFAPAPGPSPSLPPGAGPAGPAPSFGIQGQPDGLTSAMKGALSQMLPGNGGNGGL